ncbi:23S rRNA (uracil(1939)-C(5))-methyltransferase RlmD [Saccharibacillus deserti]|uniref:23S rRNA (uracil(1939)-C(5))-methyltransferase RlmD n=1 Tax=Saccharibacillus deserti TaxID=1634444 RepID=UPI0031B648C1
MNKNNNGRSTGKSGGQGRGGKSKPPMGASAGRSRGGAGRTNTGRGRGGARPEEEIEGLPVAKNDEVTLDIIGMNHNGEGVGRAEGYTLFVAGALPGEKISAKVINTKKQYGYAKMGMLLEKSPSRVEAPCEIFDRCGGCQIQHLDYAAQLEWKRQQVADSLQRIGKLNVRTFGAEQTAEYAEEASTGQPLPALEATGFGGGEGRGNAEEQAGSPAAEAGTLAAPAEADSAAGEGEASGGSAAADGGSLGVLVPPTLGMGDPWRYRNKAQVPIGEENDRLIGGFYARGTHRIVDMETCIIQHEANDEMVETVKAIGRELGIPAYDEETGRGLLRHVVVKVAFATGEKMVVLVTNSERLPKAEQWIAAIQERVPGVKSICHNVNMRQTNVIFGDVTTVLWGEEVIHDYIGEIKFAISARSFYQVNPAQTEVLYGKTLEYAGLTGQETVIDAYCGIGTISLFLAQKAKRVYGVEIVKEAIEDARKNAEINGITNAEFEVGASEDVIPRWREQGITPDVIVVDPPRKGCDIRLLETIIEMKPERVVYVSCNPATLARDLRVLEDGGFKTVKVQPVDMFPQTVHVEAVALLTRRGLE